jgi:hypothetical protein
MVVSLNGMESKITLLLLEMPPNPLEDHRAVGPFGHHV